MENDRDKVALILGGIYPHAALAKKLQKRGYYTLLVDYFKNPPAASSVDEHSTESAMDVDAVLRLAKDRHADLVMSPCLDQQMVIAMQVSEALGLPHPFSSETALQVTNKKYMKRIMTDNNIPTARYYEIDDDTRLQDIKLDYPVMVKAVDASGGAGIYKLETPEGLEDALERARRFSRSKTVIVEEFKQGIEVSIYAYVSGGKAKIVTTAERISEMDESHVRCFCTVSPSPAGERVRETMAQISTDIARAFGLDNTPLFVQFILNEQGAFVLEFSPRLGGGTCYRTAELNAKYDLLDAAIDSYLGNSVVVDSQKEEGIFLVQIVYAHDGIFDHVEKLDQLKEEGYVVEEFYLKTSGMEVSSEKASSARIVTLLVYGQTEEELLRKSNHIMDTIEVVDPEGRDITDRSLRFKGSAAYRS